MSIFDKAKQAAERAKGQAANLASQHSDKIDQALQKGGDFVDRKTHGRYSDKIVKARTAAGNASTRLGAQADTPRTAPADVDTGEPSVAPPPPNAGTTPPPPAEGTMPDDRRQD